MMPRLAFGYRADFFFDAMDDGIDMRATKRLLSWPLRFDRHWAGG